MFPLEPPTGVALSGQTRVMRAVVQRVTSARVTVDGEVVGEIGQGLCVLVGVTHHDSTLHAKSLAEKVWQMRIFSDDAGVMNLAAADVGGEILVVSQFTLYADTARGRRPSWTAAAPAAVAEPLVDAVVERLRAMGAKVATGEFGAHMQVALENDGPVTILLDV